MSQELNNPSVEPVKSQGGSTSMGDTFLSSLSDLEGRINALKQLHEQTSVRESGIATREQELSKREHSLASVAEKLEKQKAEIEQLRARMEAQLEATRAEQETQGRELARQAQQLDEQRRASQQRSDEIEKRERETTRGHAEMEKLRASINEQVSRVEREEQERDRALAAREKDLADREKDLAALRVKSEAELARAAREEEETRRTQARLEEFEKAIAERERSIQEREKTLGEERLRAREDENRLMQELAERERGVEAAGRDLDEREFDIKRLTEQLERERAGVVEQARMLAEQMKAKDDEHNAAIWANRQEEMQMQLGELAAAKARLETELQHAKADVEAVTQELIDANSKQGVPKDEHDRAQQRINELTRQVEENQATVQMLQQHLDASIRNARGAEEERTRDLKQMEEKLRDANAELSTRAREAQERKAEAESKDKEVKALLAKTQELQDKVDASVRQLAEIQTQASAARTQLDNSVAREKYEELSKELVAAKELLEHAEKAAKNQVSQSVVRERDALIAGLQQAMVEAERSAADLRKQEAEEREALISQLRDQLKQVENAQAITIADEIQRCEATIAELRTRLESAEKNGSAMAHADVAARDERIAELTRQLGEVQQKAAHAAGEEIQRRDRKIAELEARLAGEGTPVGVSAEEHERAVEQRDEKIAGLMSQVARAEQALKTSISPSLLEERDRRIADLEQRLDSLAAQTIEGASVDPSEITKRDEAIVLLRERLDQALAERGELIERVQAAESRGGADTEIEPDTGPTDADYRRRDRLRRYKSMLQGQARKILAAQQALQKRHIECEAILQHRMKLAQMAQQLARVEKKVSGSKARTGAAAAVLYFTATLGILGGLSWEVSKRVWPGTYIARAVVEADVGRRPASAEELASWQKDHQEMLADPRLAEFAAERMRQRGLANVGSAADLSERLKQNMYMQSTKPGAITIELRGEGAEKTQLVLDTLVTSFKAVSDQSRDERANDIGLVIGQAAMAGTEPLMDKRIERAASVFAGAALAAGLAGLVIWSRLVRAKRKFDQASAVEAAMAEVDWTTLEASMKKGVRESES